jgi:hypothetical protein
VASRDSLAVWEIALIKAFMSFTGMNDQEILPYFSRPGRSINHRVIAEIRVGSHFSDVEVATEEELRVFKERWFGEYRIDSDFGVLFVEQSCNRPGQADKVVEFIRAGTEAAEEIDRVIFKDRERAKYKPAQIVAEMKKRGFAWFNMSKHTEIRRKFDAKNPKNGYGVELADNQWYYYDNWLEKVSEHCIGASE